MPVLARVNQLILPAADARYALIADRDRMVRESKLGY
jgi:hypothetical protein